MPSGRKYPEERRGSVGGSEPSAKHQGRHSEHQRQRKAQLKQRAIRLVVEARDNDEGLSQHAAVARVSKLVGVHPDTLRVWVRQIDINAGRRPGVTTDAAARIKELERENRELKRARRDPVSGVVFLCAGTRPATSVLVGFIDENRARFGVESICRVLTEHGCRIAPSGYYAAKKRSPSKRAVRDAEVLPHIIRVHSSRRQGRHNYGAKKVWAELRKE
jgi:transposase-like protein